ncbi:hypothetical protein KEH51_24485 [[Brevibacterium] frigoritolerans]|uniref:Uncharacterized protein n=1 Tax=Peribacillus frigoritolerans TaxID=450367 RepID=A0A941FJP6_9BACI|nr:hypothetical protein [Peribacillus frigoritolerans]
MLWQEGRRTTSWIKVKNWKTVSCFITALHKENGYVSLAVFKEGAVTKIGSVKNGLSARDKSILHQLIKQNASDEDAQFFISIHPFALKFNSCTFMRKMNCVNLSFRSGFYKLLPTNVPGRSSC